ncbi:MAG: alpha/beta hydrolase [Leptolyngbyaceae cyanobacterium bins.59]|nr:alpha/beta hydrolase [Leptolyngbyaceae cyanobacterium bins.59]
MMLIMRDRLSRFTALFSTGFLLLTLVLPGQAKAAERIVLRYLIFEQSVAVQELEALAEKGEVSPTLESYFSMAKQDPATIRQTLTRPVQIDVLLLDRVLNHPLGERLLDEMGKMIHTGAGGADRQALRAALVLSASGDNQVSLLEVIQKYPTEGIYVEGERILDTYAQLSRAGQLAQDIQKVVESIQKLGF